MEIPSEADTWSRGDAGGAPFTRAAAARLVSASVRPLACGLRAWAQCSPRRRRSPENDSMIDGTRGLLPASNRNTGVLDRIACYGLPHARLREFL